MALPEQARARRLARLRRWQAARWRPPGSHHTIEIQPGISLTEELNQARGRRRSILRWGEESYVSELHLVPSSWIYDACGELGLTIVERHSTPDQAMPNHSGVLLVVRKP